MSSLINVPCTSILRSSGPRKPIIGVLAQEAHSVRKFYPDEYLHSFIAASYVKFVESAGGEVLPIMIGKSAEYYKTVIYKTNGLLLPGGAALFNEPSGFAEAGQYLYDFALEANARGDFYPVLGICLGMEFLIQASLQGQEIRSQCVYKKESLPLKLKNDLKTSRMFSGASDDILRILSTENVTANSHKYCFTEKTFQALHLTENWRVLSTNYDDNGLEFISSYEHARLPFYGVQFHPEKNAFEFEEQYEHGESAIAVGHYFGNYFISECRKNAHLNEDAKDELIYKYTPRFSGGLGSIYQQIYVFQQDE